MFQGPHTKLQRRSSSKALSRFDKLKLEILLLGGSFGVVLCKFLDLLEWVIRLERGMEDNHQLHVFIRIDAYTLNVVHKSLKDGQPASQR